MKDGRREAFLVRKASDYGGVAPRSRQRGASGVVTAGMGMGAGGLSMAGIMNMGFGLGSGGGSSSGVGAAATGIDGGSAGQEGWTGTPGRLVEGIGVDARRYVEALLSLGR